MCHNLHILCSDDEKEEVLRDAEKKLVDLQNTKWLMVAKELQGEDPYQFLRAYSPGGWNGEFVKMMCF